MAYAGLGGGVDEREVLVAPVGALRSGDHEQRADSLERARRVRAIGVPGEGHRHAAIELWHAGDVAGKQPLGDAGVGQQAGHPSAEVSGRSGDGECRQLGAHASSLGRPLAQRQRPGVKDVWRPGGDP